MRNYLLAAVAAAALATPAMARDKSVYVGVDAGVMLVEDTNLDLNYDYDIDFTYDFDDALTIDHNLGFDVDLVAGYDFGLVRGEIELGYKRASVDEVQVSSDAIEFFTGVPDTNPTEPFDGDGDVRVWSAMANILFDFGDEDGWSGFLGAGAGWANVKYDFDIGSRSLGIPSAINATVSDDDGAIAWQILAGIRKAITPNIDLGLKYRFFNVSKLDFNEPGLDFTELDGRFRSHSLLLSLMYNFYTPATTPPSWQSASSRWWMPAAPLASTSAVSSRTTRRCRPSRSALPTCRKSRRRPSPSVRC
jgi:OOP family OmpA-OmpF porin